MPRRLEQYDYDYGPLGPLAALHARSTHSDYPGMIAPPKGWIDLVIQLDRDLAKIFPHYTLTQVKEKFGGLRYYIGAYNPKIATEPSLAVAEANALIATAENASYRICQVCGEPGKSVDDYGWAITLCPDHTTEFDA